MRLEQLEIGKKIRVEVTQEDLDNGYGGCSNCPLALALRRTFQNDDSLGSVCVGTEGADICHLTNKRENRKRIFLLLGSRARQLVSMFDRGREIKPKTVTMEVVGTSPL